MPSGLGLSRHALVVRRAPTGSTYADPAADASSSAFFVEPTMA